jgi:hypothetical protein
MKLEWVATLKVGDWGPGISSTSSLIDLSHIFASRHQTATPAGQGRVASATIF